MDDSILLSILHVPFCSKHLKESVGGKVPETRLRRLLQQKLMCSFTKQPLGIKLTAMKWNVHGAASPATHNQVRQHCNRDLEVSVNAQ